MNESPSEILATKTFCLTLFGCGVFVLASFLFVLPY